MQPATQTLSDLRQQVDQDFLLAMQENPVIVAQLIAWDMVKRTPSWPPESLAGMTQLGDAMARIMACLAPPQVVMVEGEPEAETEDEEWDSGD